LHKSARPPAKSGAAAAKRRTVAALPERAEEQRVLEVRNLVKRYGTLTAVDDLSFAIERGETFGLLGPNGAGKSTAMLCTVGALKPDSGSITVDGRLDPMQAEVRRGLGLCPQTISLYAELTAEENLRFFGTLFGLEKKALQERIEYCLEFAGLADRRRDPVRTYSGGMQRRLNMAAALVHDPPVLLFDEPTVGVDPQSRNHIFECIGRLQREGRTIVYVTHYMEEVERLCSRAAIVDRGKLMACDTVLSLLARHGGASEVIAEFESAPPAGTSLPGRWEGAVCRLEATTAMTGLATIAAAGMTARNLVTHRPTLEHVFLHLTGRSLRDE
jgi:ABC-2 type transport system ATP-binding protein